MERLDASIKDMFKNLEKTNSFSERLDILNQLRKTIQINNVDINAVFKMLEKQHWDYFCMLVESMQYPKDIEAIPSLIFLLQDINWPGARMALSLLESFGKDNIIEMVEFYLKEAFNNGDEMWIAGIKQLALKLDIKPTDFTDIDSYRWLLHADY